MCTLVELILFNCVRWLAHVGTRVHSYKNQLSGDLCDWQCHNDAHTYLHWNNKCVPQKRVTGRIARGQWCYKCHMHWLQLLAVGNTQKQLNLAIR